MNTTTINQLANQVIIRAIFTLVFVTISFIIGIKLILKYLKSKEDTILSVGFTLIFIGSSYWGLAFNFLSILLFNYQFDHSFSLFLSYGFIPLAIICWFYSFGKLYSKNKFKQIFYPVFIIYINLFIIQIVLLCLDHEYIAIYLGNTSDPFQYRRTLILYLVSIPALLLVIVPGTILCIKFFRLKDPQIVWKGRFLFMAICAYVFATILDVFSSRNLILQIVTRLILIICSIFFYFGFFIPKRIVNILVKE